jgi:hypothetical protein
MNAVYGSTVKISWFALCGDEESVDFIPKFGRGRRSGALAADGGGRPTSIS